MNNSSIGLIETYGYLCAIEGLDVALKTSNVKLVSCEFVGGGIVTIIITGDVASVKAAVDSAAKSIEKLGELRSIHVIPRADKDVWKIINKENTSEIQNKYETSESDSEENSIFQRSENSTHNSNELIKQEFEEISEQNNDAVYKTDEYARRKKELENLKVTELRAIARKTKNIKLTKNEIKFSKKEKLIEEILKNL